MTTQIKPSPARLEAAIESLLAGLRRRFRAYVWADGVAAALVAVGASFWASLAFDWLFEPPVGLRIIALLAIILGLGYVVARFLLARVFVPLHNRNMALLIERRFGNFRESLLTAVEMAEHPAHAAEFNPDMLAYTHREALGRAATVDLGKVFNPAPLVRRISLAAALVGASLVFVVLAPEAFGVWARRNLLMSEELWPRSTHLSVEGLEPGSHVKIARGSDWKLAVRADAALGRDIPDIVEVRYDTSEGARGRENMSREGLVSPGEAPFQNYAHTFKSVLSPLEFYILGGDDRQGPFHLDVVDSPTISRMKLRCEYPAYMHREGREIPVAGLMQLPRGTQITILAEANKPLVSVQVDDVAGDGEAPPATHHLELAQEHGKPQTSFQFGVPRLDADKTLLFTLKDSDGIRSREAVRLALGAVADEPPQVNVQLKGIGTAITPQARLPAAGEISDDYGVARVWFDFHVDETPAREQPFAVAANGQEQLAAADALEVGPLELQPKQKLHWAVQAADSCALEGGPNVGSSQRYVLEVVTAEQLRAMLEARELTLRRRFETIIEELTETRNMLSGIEMRPPAAATEVKQSPAETKPAAAPSGSEPGDDDADNADVAKPAASSAASRALQVERVLQNGQRSSHETLQVALAFDEIREEMINNRVDTEELKTRLKEGVADPLKRIVEARFAALEESLKQLAAVLADPNAAVTAQAKAVAKTDAILVEMQQVLDKMLELETFNEVLDMLRQIIDAQEKVNAETKQKQKQKLRDLIE
jgi:tetrahydromethanopterin S-methyltransferase subunit B